VKEDVLVELEVARLGSETALSSLPTQTMLSSLKRTSSNQGSGMTIPSFQAVSTQQSFSYPHMSITSSGSLLSTRLGAATPVCRLSAIEPVEHVST
jgi:hypothetical protein